LEDCGGVDGVEWRGEEGEEELIEELIEELPRMAQQRVLLVGAVLLWHSDRMNWWWSVGVGVDGFG
jgi:hypothetical protein